MSSDKSSQSTRSVHAGEPRKRAGDAITTPIHQTATYTFEDTQELIDHFEARIEREEYGRYGNPTVDVAERKLAALDNAEDAALFPSGMAAITTTLLAMLRGGHHVVMTNDCYRRTRQFVGGTLAKFGVECTLVDPDDYEALEDAITSDTRLIMAESPTNPYMYCADLEKLVEIRDRHKGVKVIIDSTFATPINQRPIDFGIDLVWHSCTKYLGGHNDLLAGSMCGKAPLIQAIKDFRGVVGTVVDPQTAYLLIRGLKTLDLRVRRQNENAQQIAEWLEAHPKIERVYYPGLESHPSHQVAREQMEGYGGVVSFLVDGELEAISKFIDACEIPQIGPSLGGVESLIEQPALMSFFELTTEQRESIGIRDNLVRFAIGIEDAQDLIDDLEQALEHVALAGHRS
ncbi:MAG: trans-sulfuration enzyme family protein [Myxococcota bacterium]